MSSSSSIEWTDATWNPVTGCDRVSPGCAHCYALELAPRLRAMGSRRYIEARDGGPSSGPAFGVTLHPAALTEPLRWRKPRRVFVNSMSDLFHDEIPAEFIAEVFAVMALAGRHTFQVLTKRPERMRDLLTSWRFCKLTMAAIADIARRENIANAFILTDVVNEGFEQLDNVWLGVTVENRRFVHRADILRATPAAVRFISAEPLLGPLVARFEPEGELGEWVWPDGRTSNGADSLDLGRIDWLIVGGESGARHRSIDQEWVRALRDEAQRMRVAFFFKQWGGRTPKAGGRELDGRTWDELPAREAVPA